MREASARICMKFRIRSKLLASFMAMVALIIALIVFAVVSMRMVTTGNKRLIYAQKKESLVSDLQTTIDRAVTALGDYLVSGKKSRRTTFIQLVLLYKKQMEALEKAALPAAGEERAAIASLKAEMDSIDGNSREVLALADKIEKSEGHKLIQDVVASARGALAGGSGTKDSASADKDLRMLENVLGVSTRAARARMNELEALGKTISESESKMRELASGLMKSKEKALELIADLRELAQKDAAAAAESASLAERNASKSMLVGALVVLASGIGLALYLARSFSSPVLDLGRGARFIGDGNFSHRIRLQTGDELEELAGRFNAMAERLEASYGLLEERVRERTRELERSGERLRRLFDGISDGISVIGSDYKILNVNRGIAAMAGQSEAGLVGKSCYNAYNGSDYPCEGCPAGSVFETGAASSRQLRWCVAGRKTREMLVTIFPLIEQEGRVVQAIEYAKDISDKVALERKLFQSAKLAGIGTLAAGVAHEIRNPLGIMKTSADMIRRNSRDGEQNRELAEFMIEEVDRLNRVVTRLLDFARPQAPKIEPCEVAAVMERALALVGPQYRLQDFEIVKEYAGGIQMARGDHEQLCQVFLNLIINAAQAMPAGGRLTLSSGAGDGEGVWASVGDTGAGIDDRIMESIFDPFFTTKEDGSGLGLAIAYRIVESHKGRLDVKSAPGKGTTFTITLPAA